MGTRSPGEPPRKGGPLEGHRERNAMEGREEAELCAGLVRTESTDPGTYEGALEAQVRAWLEGRVRRAGLGDVVRFRELEALPGRPCLSACVPGRDGSCEGALVFCCHMDTVVVGDGWSADVDPFGADGKGYISPIVNNQRNMISTRNLMNPVANLIKFSACTCFFAQLDNCHTAFYCRFNAFFDRSAGHKIAVGAKIK